MKSHDVRADKLANILIAAAFAIAVTIAIVQIAMWHTRNAAREKAAVAVQDVKKIQAENWQELRKLRGNLK